MSLRDDEAESNPFEKRTASEFLFVSALGTMVIQKQRL